MTCKIECTRCGLLLPCSAVLPLLCGCGHRHRDRSELQQVDAPPGVVQKAATVLTAYAKWKMAGSPVRPAAEAEAIRAICQACPLFQADGTCGACGCKVKPKSEWATERCPLDPPKW